MADSYGSIKGVRKIKNEASSSKNSFFSGDSIVSERRGGRISLFPGSRAQKLLINNSSDKSSFKKDKEITTYENYEIEYSTYLLRKLQNRILEKNNKEKEENIKKSLVSLKLELEDSLKKHVELSGVSARGEMYMKTIKECNKRLELAKILKVFEDNQLDTLLLSVSKHLNQSINLMPLIGISKDEVERVFSREVIGEESQLMMCLKNIHHYSNQNKESIEKMAKEILMIEKLLNENSTLRERHNNHLRDATLKTVERSYETLSGIIEKGMKRRLENPGVTPELFEFDELVECTEHLFPPDHALPEGQTCVDEPLGSSTPYNELR